MEEINNEKINQTFGMIFQKYREKKNITQEKFAEQLSKSAKTISQIETGKDGTSKKTDICLMNSLEITPNTLYKSFITNSKLKKTIELEEKINNLEPNKIDALSKIIDILDNL